MCVYVELTKGARAIVDVESVPLISAHNWQLHSAGYASSAGGLMHSIILPCVNGQEPDHRNRIKLDNRKSNLRRVTRKVNSLNRDVGRNNTSGHVGVSFWAKRGKWMARIMVAGKGKTLGYFDSKDQAIERRIQGEIELFGARYGKVDHLQP